MLQGRFGPFLLERVVGMGYGRWYRTCATNKKGEEGNDTPREKRPKRGSGAAEPRLRVSKVFRSGIYVNPSPTA